MSQKELLYVEDAISHEEIMITYINEHLDIVDDEELVNFFKKEIKKHISTKEKLFNLLKEKCNE